MRPGERLPLLTEVLEPPPRPGAEPAPQPAPPAGAGEPVPRVDACAGAAAVPATPAQGVVQPAPVSDEMARAVLELELEQALREVLEPRLNVLLRETAAELAQRLGPRMHEWLDERGSADD